MVERATVCPRGSKGGGAGLFEGVAEQNWELVVLSYVHVCKAAQG